MSKAEILFGDKPKILDDGELPTPLPIARQFTELTRGMGEMVPNKIVSYMNLSAVLKDIKKEKEAGRPSPLSHAINYGAVFQPK